MEEKQYCFCKIKIENKKNSLYYINELEDLNIGDFVEVPFGYYNEKKQGIVLEMENYYADNAPYYVEQTKKIIRKIDKEKMDIIDGDLQLDYSKTKIIKYIGSTKDLKEYTIPSYIMEIAPRAFENIHTLEKVHLNEGLKVIGREAFKFTNIKKVKIPSSVEKIGVQAFTRDGDIHSEYSINKDNRHFRTDNNCLYKMNDNGTDILLACWKVGISEIDIDDEVIEIGEKAFYNCKRLNNIQLNEKLETIGESAFENCALDSIFIPKNVKDFSNLLQKECMSKYYHYYTINVEISPENKNYLVEDNLVYKIIDENSYQLIKCKSNKSKITINTKTKTIKSDAFQGCKKLTTVYLPESLEKIEKRAFADCQKLKTVIINSNEFKDMENCIYLPQKITVIEAETFEGCNFESIELSPQIEKIKKDAFYNCQKLKSIILPKELKELDDSLKYLDLEYVEIASENECFSSESGVLFDKLKENIVLVPKLLKEKNYIIPETVKNIGTSFSMCENIKKLVLNNNITKIMDRAFEQCTIEEYEIPSTVVDIGKKAFPISYSIENCKIIGEKGSTIEQYVKNPNNSSITKLIFIDKNISPEIYELKTTYEYECIDSKIVIKHYLKDEDEVIIPAQIESLPVVQIGDSAFKGKKVKKIKIPNSVKNIGDFAFADCVELVEIDLPKSVEKIGKYAFSYVEKIEKIELPEKLETISECVFEYCENLKSIKIPEGVTKIEAGAFFGCKLLRLEVPNTVINISQHLFSSVKQINIMYQTYNDKDLFIDNELKIIVEKNSYADKFFNEYKQNATKYKQEYFNIVYDEDITSTLEEDIELNKFEYYLRNNKKESDDIGEHYVIYRISEPDKNKKVVIPNTIKGKPVIELNIDYWGESIDEIEIPENVRIVTKMPKVSKQIKVSPENQYLNTDGKALYNKEVTKMYRLYTRDIAEFTIPASIEVICENAFGYAEKLESIEIPDSVKSIEKHAFIGCLKLKDVSGGLGLQEIGTGAFADTPFFEKKDKVIIGNSIIKFNSTDERIIIEEGIETIGNNALSIPIFSWNIVDKTTQIVLPKSLKNIGKSAFENREKLKDINLPSGLEIIASSLFENCSSLETITLPEKLVKIEDSAFRGCNKLKTLILPEKLETIEKEAFSKCESLTTIKIPDSVKTIGACAFSDCINLKTIELPHNLSEISYSLFDSCNNLESIIIPKTVKVIRERAFYSCEKLSEIQLSESLTEICKKAFTGCTLIKELFIPKNVEKISENSLPDGNSRNSYSNNITANFSKIEVDKLNQHYRSENGILYSKDLSTLIYVPNNWEGQIFEFLPQTTTIESFAFSNNKTIKKIIFHDTLQVINDSACSDCLNLEEVILPANMKEIPNSLFESCSKLKKVTWPNNLEVIGEKSFMGTALKKLDFPSSVTKINDYAFAFIKTDHITLPKTIKNIGLSIFAGVGQIEVYDSIDDNAKPATTYIDEFNGEPNSNVGWMGICKCEDYTICAASPNSTWYNHTIVVKSALTDEIKYKVHMLGADEPRTVYCTMASVWGKNAEFDFKKMDQTFEKMKNLDYKYKIAISRLEDNYNLDDETRNMYQSYLKKVGLKMVNKLIENDDYEEVKKAIEYNMITKNNIDKAISLANELKRVNILSYLMNCKNEMKK